jgi:hypothetical protein
MAGRRRAWEPVGWAMAQTDLVNRGQPTWPFGPLWSAALGHLTLCTKVTASFIFASRNFRKMSNVVKFIGNYLLVGKLRMTYQNAQKNMLYMFMSNSYMFIQL